MEGEFFQPWMVCVEIEVGSRSSSVEQLSRETSWQAGTYTKFRVDKTHTRTTASSDPYFRAGREYHLGILAMIHTTWMMRHSWERSLPRNVLSVLFLITTSLFSNRNPQLPPSCQCGAHGEVVFGVGTTVAFASR